MKIEKINISSKTSNNLYFDAVLSPSAVNENFFHDVNLLSPFGSGNTEPIFVIEKLKIVNSFILADKHLKIIFSGRNGHIVEAIAFNSKGGALEGYLTKSYKKELNIAGKIIMNEWQGKKKIEFIIQDVALQ